MHQNRALEIPGHFAVFSSWLQLEKFLQSLWCFRAKGFFPYDYFTHADELDETTLPPYQAFYSTIKNCNVLEEEYASFQKLLDQTKSEQEALQSLRLPTKPKTGPENYQWLQHLWSDNQWSTFADFLKWYNDLDVTPMIQAIENLNEFCKNIHIDFINQAISIPGVAMRVCFNSITDPAAEFHLLVPRIKIFIVCLKRTFLVGLVSFSTDTMKLVKHLFETIQTNHVRKSLVMCKCSLSLGHRSRFSCSLSFNSSSRKVFCM